MADKTFGYLFVFGFGIIAGLAVMFMFKSRANNIGVKLLPEAKRLTTTASNEETWEWLDRRGKQRQLIIHRKAKVGE